MNVYREIFIEIEKSIKTEETEIKLYSESEFKDLLKFDTRKRGFVNSFGNMIFIGKIEYNKLNLTFLKVKYDLSDNTSQMIKKFCIVFPDIILDNIHFFQDSHKDLDYISFVIFTLNGQIFNVNLRKIFENEYDYSKKEGEFEKNLDLIMTEYLGTDNYYYYYALAGGNGNIYFNRLYFNYSKVISENLYEYKFNHGLTSYIGSFFIKKKPKNGISHLKNIGNNMICFVTKDLNFQIFSRFSNKIIFSKRLKSKTNELIKFSKINFISNKIDVEYAMTKSFFFTIYVEYDIYFLQFTFEILFSSIDIKEVCPFTNNTKEKLNYYNKFDLGKNVSLTNFRVYFLKGRLIDFISYENKIWIISENSSNDYVNYDFKIISIDNSGHLKNSINFSENKGTNTLMTLLNKVKTIGDKDKKSQLLLFILSNEDLIQGEFLLDFWNNKFKKIVKKGEIPIFKQKSHLMNYLTNLKENFEIMEIIIDNIHEILSNDIICFGTICIDDVNKLIVLRNNGFSFIEETGNFEYINEMISIHESRISDLIFENKLYMVSNTFTKNLSYIKQKVFNYIMLNNQQKEYDSFYIILSLLRLTMSESLYKMTDLSYISKYFSRHDATINQFIEDNFSDSINNITNLEFLNEFIYSSIINNFLIEVNIEKIINHFIEYLNSINNLDINDYYEKSSDFIKYNNKYCEVITKLIKEKVKCMYNVSKDLLMLIFWFKKFSKINLITNPNTALFNLISFKNIYEKFIVRTQNLFIDCFSAYIICFTNISKFPYIEKIQFVDIKTINFDMTFADYVLFKNINLYGKKLFEEIGKNKIINHLISQLWASFRILDNPKIDMKIINVLFIDLEEYNSIRILMTIQKEHYLEYLWYLILSNAYLHDITQLKETINLLFCKIMDEITNSSELKFFENFLLENKFILSINSEIFSDPLLLVYHYLEDVIKRILKHDDEKFQFYQFASFYIIRLFSKNEIKNYSHFLYNILDLSIKIDINCAISCLISIIDQEYKYKGFEVLVDYCFQNEKIDNFLMYDFDKNQFEIIFSILEKKSQSIINDPENVIISINSSLDVHGKLKKDGNINYLYIYLSLLSIQNDFYNYSRILNSYIDSLNQLLEKEKYNLSHWTKIYKEIFTCLSKIKHKNESEKNNFIPLFNENQNCSLEKCLKSYGKIKAKFYLLNWNEQFKNKSKDLKDKIDKNTIIDDALMVDYVCSKSFEDKFFPFLFETNYIEYLSGEQIDKGSMNAIEKIFNCVIESQIVPRYNKFKTEDRDILHKVYLKNIIYDLNNEVFYDFFKIILSNIPTNYALLFGELIYMKNLNIPEILYDFLTKNELINFMRISLKFEKLEISLNLMIQLILENNYIPLLELNIIKRIEIKLKQNLEFNSKFSSCEEKLNKIGNILKQYDSII